VRISNVLILVVAIVMGSIAAFLARSWMQSQVQTTIATTIVVATRPLNFGEAINADAVTEVPWSASTLPEGAFPSSEALLKDGRRVALTTIGRNEPILRSKITGPGQRASLSTTLENGMRAVTVRVDDVRGVAGFILPNDHVDVVLIRADTESARRQSYSELLLQNVKVLAIDQIASEQKESPTVAKAVTLEVTPLQAQKISLAIDVGHLSLVLRQPGEANTVSTSRVTEQDLSESEPAPIKPVTVSQAPAPVEAPPPRRDDTATIAIIRDLKRQEYKVLKFNRTPD
jgi:pilus assembly protein CpaB